MSYVIELCQAGEVTFYRRSEVVLVLDTPSAAVDLATGLLHFPGLQRLRIIRQGMRTVEESIFWEWQAGVGVTIGPKNRKSI